MNTYSKYAYGVTDEEEENLKDLSVPYWSKNGTLIYKRDNLGNLMFADSTFSDPDAPILNVLTSATNVIFDPETPIEEIDELYGKALLEAIRTFSEPFVDQPLLSGQIIEALDGKDENGNFIEGYNPEYSQIQNVFAKINYSKDVLIPRFLKEGFSYTVGEKSEKLKSGDIDAAEELISKLTGQRFYKVDNKALTTNLFFKMKDFIDDSKEIKQIVTGKAATPEDQMSELLKANRVYYRSYTKLAKAIKAARVFNVDEQEIRKLVNDRLGQAGLNSDQRDFLLSSTSSFQGLRLTENQIKKAQALDPTFKQKYQTLNTRLSYLPTYDLEYELPEERQEAQKEAIEILQGRRNFVDGAAVSKDYPVPFASEVPAEREDVMSNQSYETQANAEPINPFTGKPYTDIYKKRIELQDGGRVSRKKEYKEKLQELEDFISKNRLVSKEAQMSQMMGEGYRDPRFIATTGNELIDKYGLHPLAPEGSGQVLYDKQLGLQVSPDKDVSVIDTDTSVSAETLGTYSPSSDKLKYQSMTYNLGRTDSTPEQTQAHEIVHRAAHRSGYMNKYGSRLQNKIRPALTITKGPTGKIFKSLISEGLAEAYEYKFINGDISDKKFKDILKFRVENIVKGTRLSPSKTTNLLLKELPTIIDDFESYLKEIDAQ